MLIRKIFFFILVFASYSCVDLKDNEEVINVEDEFDIRLYEALEMEPRSLILEISSTEFLECKNAMLSCDLQLNPSIVLDIQDITLPEDCILESTKAICVNDLSLLADGTHSIQLSIRDDIINLGAIIKSTSAYQIDLDTDHGISYYEEELLRLPNQLIWGKVTLLEENEEVFSFVNSLQAEMNMAQLELGNYGHFKITEQGFELLDMNNDDPAIHPFIFRYSTIDEFESIREFIENFRTTYEEKAVLEIFNSEGLEI